MKIVRHVALAVGILLFGLSSVAIAIIILGMYASSDADILRFFIVGFPYLFGALAGAGLISLGMPKRQSSAQPGSPAAKIFIVISIGILTSGFIATGLLDENLSRRTTGLIVGFAIGSLVGAVIAVALILRRHGQMKEDWQQQEKRRRLRVRHN